MQKAFQFVCTEHEVVPDKDSDLQPVVNAIVSRAVVVRTPDLIGSAVIIGNAIITSIFLVRNYRTVRIYLANGEQSQAFVVAVDEQNNLARLEEMTLCIHRRPPGGALKIARCRDIGSPLLTTNTVTGRPVVKVGGMSYVTHLCGRKESEWKIDPGSPRGVMGSGVWNDEGDFVGLSLGQKIPSAFEQTRVDDATLLGDSTLKLPRVYALPAEAVLDFAERAI